MTHTGVTEFQFKAGVTERLQPVPALLRLPPRPARRTVACAAPQWGNADCDRRVCGARAGAPSPL